MVDAGQTLFPATNQTFGKSMKGQVKILTIAYSVSSGPKGKGRIQTKKVKQGRDICLEDITIYNATYGGEDITMKLASMVGMGEVEIPATEFNLNSDPMEGHVKTLSVVYKIGNRPLNTKICLEGEAINLTDDYFYKFQTVQKR